MSQAARRASAVDAEKIECMICGEEVHHIGKHLKSAHPDNSIENYQQQFPNAPLMSEYLKNELAARKAKQRHEDDQEAVQQMAESNVIQMRTPEGAVKRPMHEVFDIPLDEFTRKMGKGDPILIDVLENLDPELQIMVPAIDPEYVFKAEVLKFALIAIQCNKPGLIYGMHGTGKTTLLEQICARTNRPLLRIQHTATTEEAHILGQMVVRNKATEFDEGPLADAMRKGIIYLADEYDIAHPGVHAVYQPVMEGKPLFIKEAPPAQRLIVPHENFRFFATGNTNGSGDDTGLYSGTNIGNSANYSRFGVTIRLDYPPADQERDILMRRLKLPQNTAESLVDIANRVREQYAAGELSLPMSPREVINAAELGGVQGGKWKSGIELAFTNRLPAAEAEAVLEVAQRVLGY